MCKICVLISKEEIFNMKQILNWGKKDKIPQLKPKDVDGTFVTGASQDHLVGFHKMTIFTGQGNIRKLLGISHNSEAELTLLQGKIKGHNFLAFN